MGHVAYVSRVYTGRKGSVNVTDYTSMQAFMLKQNYLLKISTTIDGCSLSESCYWARGQTPSVNSSRPNPRDTIAITICLNTGYPYTGQHALPVIIRCIDVCR